ncbi:MAG: MerC domain-containing protein [Lachnospiraceae bacterium]|nr:MerC domain-containing protein [Lachnospiraceae bacterium]
MAEPAETQILTEQIHQLQYRMQQTALEHQMQQSELASLTLEVQTLTKEAEAVCRQSRDSLKKASSAMDAAQSSQRELESRMEKLGEAYLSLQSLSTALKNITQLTDELHTRFHSLHELRKISVGYVVALDRKICTTDVVRKRAETAYLQATQNGSASIQTCWLSYAVMAVTHWSEDEEQAAARAVSEALFANERKSILFFLLLNLKFARLVAAQKWYLVYLNRTDPDRPGREWQYLLQSCLHGDFGMDTGFLYTVNRSVSDQLARMRDTHPDYDEKIISESAKYARAYPYSTKNEYEMLRRFCPEYEKMKELLSFAEKNAVLAQDYRKSIETCFAKDKPSEAEWDTRKIRFSGMETFLHELVNSCDGEEERLLEEINYNERVVRAGGNLKNSKQAQKPVETPPRADQRQVGLPKRNRFAKGKPVETICDLLLTFAFQVRNADPVLRQFALASYKQQIAEGFSEYAKQYRQEEKLKYRISINGWEMECSEDSYAAARKNLQDFYSKKQAIDIRSDSWLRIFFLILLAAFGFLGITAVWFHNVTLVIGILLGITGGFFLWQRISYQGRILQSNFQSDCVLLRKTLDELGKWRKRYQEEDVKNAELLEIIMETEPGPVDK